MLKVRYLFKIFIFRITSKLMVILSLFETCAFKQNNFKQVCDVFRSSLKI